MKKSLDIARILPVREKTFQADSNIVWSVWQGRPNYRIEYNKECVDKSFCAIYFSSNDIYYPNTENIFKKRILERDFYEWYGNRIDKVYKHIFIRDIFKQWYLTGINADIDCPEKLIAFLKQETQGMKVVTVGSSAGGYAAILYGTWLNAVRIMAFNAQFELESALVQVREDIYPLIHRLRATDRRKYYDLKNVIDLNNSNIYYFYSSQSKWDIMERRHISDCTKIQIIRFKTAHHGIPFLKVALKKVLNSESAELDKYVLRQNHPVWFTIRMVGIPKTILGFICQVYKAYRKRR